MAKKILTFGMLAYNNPTGTKKVLKSVLIQLKTLSSEDQHACEILISDNSENDSISNLIKNNFSNEKIVYIKNPINIGFDGNVDQVLRRSRGHFCWTMSDNDPVQTGFIAKLLAFLKKNSDLSLIILDREENPLTKKTFSVIYKNYQEFFIKENFEIFGALISQDIFNTSALPVDTKKYYGNYWMHLSIIFEIGVNKQVAVVQNGLLPSTNEECPWAGGGHVFHTSLSLYKIISNLEKFGYKKNIISKIKKGMAKSLPRNIASARLHGLPISRDNTYKIFSNFKKYPLQLLLSFCMYLCPIPLLVILKRNMYGK